MLNQSKNWRIEKIKSLEEAASLAARFKAEGKKIVTVYGTFDVIHSGHLDLLEEAKRQGDVLFVGVNSDAAVKEGKGPNRPYLPEGMRSALLAAMICTDYVVVIDAPFYSGVAEKFVRAIKPDVHIGGPDYGPPETWGEYQAMQDVGAYGHWVPDKIFSTTDLVKKIKDDTGDRRN
jgi:D-glycero-beta-D-manno-heptose 1-phosphate adenylyltransferase